MPSPDLCTEEEIAQLVHNFYARVRQDATLAPIFDAHVRHWDTHLAKMVDFWSSALRGTARFRGAPRPRHAAIPDLSAELFGRWLVLFHETTAALSNRPMCERANALAGRMAEGFWYGWQFSRRNDALPAPL